MRVDSSSKVIWDVFARDVIKFSVYDGKLSSIICVIYNIYLKYNVCVPVSESTKLWYQNGSKNVI